MSYPFNRAEELKDVGMYPAVPKPYGMPAAPARKFNTPITPKENLLRIFRKEMPLWLPNISTDCNFIQPLVMPDAMARWKGGKDWFGIEWQYEPMTNAAMVKPGTRRLSDITNWEKEIVWPDLNAIDWEKDYKETYEPVISKDRATIFVIVNGLFERLADLTSFEDAFCYLLEEPEALTAFYEKLTDWHIELIKIAKKYYHADIINFHDDMGSQKSSFMSPATYREMLQPHYQRICKAIHDEGMYVIHHSCGNIGNLLPAFIEDGWDCWEGQDTCNDKLDLMERYGKDLAQDSSFAIPAELPDDQVEGFIKERIETLGKDGRYFATLRDGKAERQPKSEEMMYCLSREYYQSK